MYGASFCAGSPNGLESTKFLHFFPIWSGSRRINDDVSIIYLYINIIQCSKLPVYIQEPGSEWFDLLGLGSSFYFLLHFSWRQVKSIPTCRYFVQLLKLKKYQSEGLDYHKSLLQIWLVLGVVYLLMALLNLHVFLSHSWHVKACCQTLHELS